VSLSTTPNAGAVPLGLHAIRRTAHPREPDAPSAAASAGTSSTGSPTVKVNRPLGTTISNASPVTSPASIPCTTLVPPDVPSDSEPQPASRPAPMMTAAATTTGLISVLGMKA
jgi:hypothetical protein